MSSAQWQEVLDFWFADACEDPERAQAAHRRWFGTAPDVDRAIRERFAGLVDSALGGGLAAWVAYPRGRLGLVLLLDQFPRNLFRGTSRAFAGDARAGRLALSGIDAGADAPLHPLQCVFLYMPLQHAEDAAMQTRSVRMFESLLAQADEPWRALMQSFVTHARQHRDVIERFGRFPHRNDALGRPSTAEELAYLAGGGHTWGQASAAGDTPV